MNLDVSFRSWTWSGQSSRPQVPAQHAHHQDFPQVRRGDPLNLALGERSKPTRAHVQKGFHSLTLKLGKVVTH